MMFYPMARAKIRNFFWRARTSGRAARHVSHFANPVFDDFFEYGRLRAHLARAIG